MSKTILITGCSKGFGYLFSLALAKKGYRIIATSRALDRMQKLKDAAETASLPITLYELDVTKKETIQNVIEQIIKKFGRIDVLINNAGYGLSAFFEHATEKEVYDQFNTNLFGLISVTQAVIPIMKKQKQGHIINISSAATAAVSPGMSFYAATKWALEALTEGMYLELKHYGINVTSIQPGPYKTDFGNSSIHNKKTNDLYSNKRIQDNFVKDPKEVVALLIKVLSKKHPKIKYPVGWVSQLIFFLRKVLPANTFLKFEEFILGINKINQK